MTNEDRNIITDELIEGAMGVLGEIWVSDIGTCGALRKPVKNRGRWCVRNYGLRPVLSYLRLSTRSVHFRIHKFHAMDFSKRIIHDGGDKPDWIDYERHVVCGEIFNSNGPGLWRDVESFYVQARYESDLPEQYREAA